MTLSPDLFRRDFQKANSLIDGAHGSVLETIAKATAATRKQMIPGYLIFGGSDLIIGSECGTTSEFVIDKSYRSRYDEDRETALFAEFAPFLAILAITDQIDVGKYGDKVRRACEKMNVHFNGNYIEHSARLMFDAYASGSNKIPFSKYALLVRANYFSVMEKLVMNEYRVGDYIVIPNFAIRSMSALPVFHHWMARLSTNFHAKRLAALSEAIASR